MPRNITYVNGIEREVSAGHIALVPGWQGGLYEYFERDGEIWRAYLPAPVMPDGYRAGRWFHKDNPAVRRNLVSFDARSSVPSC